MTLQSTLQLYHGQIAEWVYNTDYDKDIIGQIDYKIHMFCNNSNEKQFSIKIMIREVNLNLFKLSIEIETNTNIGGMLIMDYCDTLKEAKENAVIWVMKLIGMAHFVVDKSPKICDNYNRLS